MGRFDNAEKVSSNLEDKDKNLLFDLSKTLKDLDLCEGYHRKALFTTARYDSWFISSVPRTLKTFKEIFLEIEGFIDEEKREHLLAITKKLSGGFTDEENIITYHKYRAGLLDDEELFLFVESFKGDEHNTIALQIISKLQAKYGTDHAAIKSLSQRFVGC